MNSFSRRPSLCIGIPTYNRPEALCRRINEVNQYADLINEILICDNSENTSPLVMETINSTDLKCTYIKNPDNIGAGANFLRVLENASTDYVWWRGDDDVISTEQVVAVTSNLSQNPRLILISMGNKEVFISKGIDAFVENFTKIEVMLWASAVIVPVEIAKKVLPLGYSTIDWPHVSIVLGLFQVCPDLEFIAVPFTLNENEFRDVGREGQSWPLFNTSIKEFPRTAFAIKSDSLKKQYLRNWRKTKKFYLIRTMVGMKLGISTQEKIRLSTFTPLLSLSSPKASLLGIVLYLMSKVPRSFYQMAFAIYWTRLAYEKKISLRLDYLLPHSNFRDVFKALRELDSFHSVRNHSF